jgi:3-oxoacyl-[acyl-carrier protein] reductase
MAARRLEGKRCLVTGGSRGLGLAIGLAFARAGGRVAFTYSRNTEDAADARAQLRAAAASAGTPEALGEPLDFRGAVSDAAHVSETVGALTKAWGGVDVLVNCAGPTQILPIALLEEADWDSVMNGNVKGAYLFSRAVLKSMIRARAGHILNIGTFASERVVEAPVHYAAAKAALRGMTEALAKEVGRYNIKVNLVAPGLLDAGLSRTLPRHRLDEYVSQCPIGRLGSVTELADAVTFLVSDENTFMTGAKLGFDGGV